MAKKNGSVRIAHDLQPLNAITIQDVATLPYVEHFAEQSTGQSVYMMMDLFVGFDHRALAEESRDLTTFQTPLGTFRLTILPQRWTDSPPVFQNNVAFILQHEIDIAPNFLNDINVLGPKLGTRTAMEVLRLTSITRPSAGSSGNIASMLIAYSTDLNMPVLPYQP